MYDVFAITTCIITSACFTLQGRDHSSNEDAIVVPWDIVKPRMTAVCGRDIYPLEEGEPPEAVCISVEYVVDAKRRRNGGGSRDKWHRNFAPISNFQPKKRCY
jgi:hypothetical protein